MAARIPEDAGSLHLALRAEWVLTATVLGSAMAQLDATVVGIAQPAIGKEFHAQIAGLQWVSAGYLLTVAGLILLAGALCDRYGRRKIFVIGVTWFAVASLICATAPNIGLLIAARCPAGLGGALLTPGSLAILEASFAPEERGRAIGAWSGLGGVATALGPFVGGFLITAVSWRLIFLINSPIAAAVLYHLAALCPGNAGPRRDGLHRHRRKRAHRRRARGHLVRAHSGVERSTGRRPRWSAHWSSACVALVAFIIVELHVRAPIVPLDIFKSRQFSATNVTPPMLVPFYFLVGQWGGPDRVAATFKLVVYTLVGSLLMLAAAVATGVTGRATPSRSPSRGSPRAAQRGPAAAAVRRLRAGLPDQDGGVPVQGWTPDAYRKMPMPALAVFSAVLSKVAAYGFLPIALPIFPGHAGLPDDHDALALAAVIYGSAQAFTQTNARLILGYPSLAQLSFITLGIFRWRGDRRPGRAPAAGPTTASSWRRFLLRRDAARELGRGLGATSATRRRGVPRAGPFHPVPDRCAGHARDAGLGELRGEFLILLGPSTRSS